MPGYGFVFMAYRTDKPNGAAVPSISVACSINTFREYIKSGEPCLTLNSITS
jgi:hypothetical protein